jgi:NIMA-interacting peptidyl-prolyl cis-trans isomerase 1
MPRTLRTLLALLVTAVLFACEHPGHHDIRKRGATQTAPAPTEEPPEAEAASPPQPEEPAGEAPAPSVASGDRLSLAASGDRIAARHILVAHESAARRPMNVHRSASAAHKRALELAQRLAAGEDFATLAKAESDCTTSSKGGFLGGFDRGAMHPAFDAAAFALEPGQISEVIETPFGYHIIQREELAEVHIAQILFQYTGLERPPVARSHEEALALAQSVRERLEAGESFEELAAQVSDGPAGLRGGDLGWFTRGQFLPAWEEVAFALEPGQTSAPFETSVGIHLLLRLE